MTDLSESMSVTVAVNLVAAALLAAQQVELDWDDAPLVGERDFDLVQAAAVRIQAALMPDTYMVAEAHLILEARAEKGFA